MSSDVTTIGPECFGDDRVICWRGVNYYADGPVGSRVWPIFRHPIHVVRAIFADYRLAASWTKRTGARP